MARSSAETRPAAGLLEALVSGQPLRFGAEPPDRESVEAALVPASAAVRASLGRHGGLEDADLDAALERLEHDFIEYRGLGVHLEVHAAGAGQPTLVVHHGLGDHVRRMTPLAARLVVEGFNVVMMDRPGHGVSEGRRGHCPLGWALELVDESIRYARRRMGGPVVLLGDSLGGITLWYALTAEPDAEAVICHCISHPDVHHDRTMAVKAPLLRSLARVTPYSPVPITRIADYRHVALDPLTREYFDSRGDPAFCYTATAAMAASYLGFRPRRSWESVRTPALVMIGAEDRMVSPRFTRECFERARPPRATYLELPGICHQMFLDHLDAALPPMVGWARGALQGA